MKFPPAIVENHNRTRSSSSLAKTFYLHDSLTSGKRIINNSYYVRTMANWNRLPSEIREQCDPLKFDNLLEIHLWEKLEEDINVTSINFPRSLREPD